MRRFTILLIAIALLGGNTPTAAAPLRAPAPAASCWAGPPLIYRAGQERCAPPLVASCWAGPPTVYQAGQARCWRGVPFVLPSEVRE